MLLRNVVKIDLLRKWLKLRLEIPFLRIFLLNENHEEGKERLFLKSAILIGKKNDCDLEIKESDIDPIVIERRGPSYFLKKPALADNYIEGKDIKDDVLELRDGDVIELDEIKIRVKFSTFSIPLYYVPAAIFFIFVCIPLFSGVENLDSLESFRLKSRILSEKISNEEKIKCSEKEPSKLKNESKKEMLLTLPVKKEADDKPEKIKKTRKKKSAKIKSEKKLESSIGIENLKTIYCSTITESSDKCERAKKFLNYYEIARKMLIAGEMKKAKMQILKFLELADDLKLNMNSRKRVHSILSDIFSYECELDYRSSRFRFARRKCLKALKYNPDNERSQRVLGSIELLVKKYYIEAYMLESVDRSRAIKSYNKVLELTSQDELYHVKARKRIAILKPFP